jgi:hypothetical protein
MICSRAASLAHWKVGRILAFEDMARVHANLLEVDLRGGRPPEKSNFYSHPGRAGEPAQLSISLASVERGTVTVTSSK